MSKVTGLSDRTEEQLKARVKESRDFVAIFRSLATKKAFIRTDVYRLRLDLQKGGYGITVDSIMREFEFLQKLRLGELKKRPLPDHTVFTWRDSSEPVITAVMRYADPSYKATENYYRPPSKAATRDPGPPPDSGPILSFTLPTGRELRLNLPEAKSLRIELERFASILK